MIRMMLDINLILNNKCHTKCNNVKIIYIDNTNKSPSEPNISRDNNIRLYNKESWLLKLTIY